MGRPTRRQIEEGRAFEHVDLHGKMLHIADTFAGPLLELRVAEPGQGSRHVIVDQEGVTALADYLDRWLLKQPPLRDEL